MILLKTLVKKTLLNTLLKIFETKEYGDITDSIPLIESWVKKVPSELWKQTIDDLAKDFIPRAYSYKRRSGL